MGASAAAAMLLTGCVERTISITSEPAGALVFLNDEEVGRTPLTVPFTFYGTYDVRLEKEGYQALWTKQKANGPWWEAPGPDLFAEAIPGARSELKWNYQLVKLPEDDRESLLQRAQQMRSQVGGTTPASKPPAAK